MTANQRLEAGPPPATIDVTDTLDDKMNESESQQPESPSIKAGEQLETNDVPKGMRFAMLFACILLASFFIGYDTSCVATLIPIITDEFHALYDLGWYTVAYILTQSATMLIYVLTAAAPTSPAFIVGRALSGFGSAGAFAGTTIIIAHTTSLKHRATYQAIVGGAETIALAFGPLISGTIAHYTSWRIGFYIIIPFAVGIIVIMAFSIDHIRKEETAHLNAKDGLKRIDWTGFCINVPMTLCLVMGLQLGGTTYSWSNWRIILLLTLAAVLIVFFLVVEHRAGDDSMVPLRVLRQRSVAFSSIITFCNYAHLSLVAYYLPFYFQAVRGATTVESGLMYLPTAVALVVGALAGGPLTSLVGYYNVALMIGSILMTVGAGLISTFSVDTSASRWISYQIIYGIGIGMAFQPPYIAVQTVLHDSVVPKALVMLSYAQQSGGIIILSIAQNVFLTKLAHNLATEVPGLAPDAVLNNGALGIINAVPAQFRDKALIAYNGALTEVFYMALGLACLAAISMLGIEWKSVKKANPSK